MHALGLALLAAVLILAGCSSGPRSMRNAISERRGVKGSTGGGAGDPNGAALFPGDWDTRADQATRTGPRRHRDHIRISSGRNAGRQLRKRAGRRRERLRRGASLCLPDRSSSVVAIDAWGNEIAAPEVTIDPGAADRWLALPIPLPAELSPGAYGLFVFVDERPLGSVAFGVTGVGTSAQLFPEPPANPRARTTAPTPGVALPKRSRRPPWRPGLTAQHAQWMGHATRQERHDLV